MCDYHRRLKTQVEQPLMNKSLEEKTSAENRIFRPSVYSFHVNN